MKCAIVLFNQFTITPIPGLVATQPLRSLFTNPNSAKIGLTLCFDISSFSLMLVADRSEGEEDCWGLGLGADTG